MYPWPLPLLHLTGMTDSWPFVFRRYRLCDAAILMLDDDFALTRLWLWDDGSDPADDGRNACGILLLLFRSSIMRIFKGLICI